MIYPPHATNIVYSIAHGGLCVKKFMANGKFKIINSIFNSKPSSRPCRQFLLRSPVFCFGRFGTFKCSEVLEEEFVWMEKQRPLNATAASLERDYGAIAAKQMIDAFTTHNFPQLIGTLSWPGVNSRLPYIMPSGETPCVPRNISPATRKLHCKLKQNCCKGQASNT